MSLSLLPLWGWIAGLAGLAGLLFALQRLRVRHRELIVATTIFWQEAVQETRARVLVRRFRHPLAYLLIVLLAAMLWTVFAGVRLAASDEREIALLLDGSARMARGTQFADAKERLLELVGTLPRERTRVIFCGATPRTLLIPGENELLLPLRLEGLAPEAAAESVTRVAMALAADELEVVVLGLAPVPAAAPGSANSGVVELGAAPARSGAYDRVDVRCVVEGDAARQVAFSLDGAPLAAESLTDLPARGGLLEATLTGPADALPADDRAQLVLPDRRVIRVALSPGGEALAGALAADPGVLITPTDPDVHVRAVDEPQESNAPELVLLGPESPATVTIRAPDVADARACARVLEAIGLADAGAVDREEGSPAVVTITASEAPGRRAATLASVLTTPRFDLTSSRAYPLAVAQLLRWLAGENRRATPTHAAAGEALPQMRTAMRDQEGRTLDPVGAAFVPPAAGTYRADDGRALAASLVSPATTLLRPATVAGDAQAGTLATRGPDASTLLLLVALVLLAVEWWLYRGGRIP